MHILFYGKDQKKRGTERNKRLNIFDLLREKGSTAVKRRFKRQLTAFSL